MTQAFVVDKAAIRPTRQPDDIETSDVTIQKLRLAGALKKGGIDVDVTQVITDGQVEDSTTGAPQLTVDILDRNYGALQSGVFGQTVDVTLDGIPYRLVEVNLTDVETLELTFEHKLVNLLRQRRSAVKASRATVTRAQFVGLLLAEISGEFPVRYVSPEVNDRQPVAGGKPTGRTVTAKTLGSTVAKSVRGEGFGVTNLNIRYWDGSTVTLGPSQLHNAAIVLQLCKQLGANAKATLAVMAACVVEPNKPFENTSGGGGGSSGILQWVNKPWSNDVVQSVTNALRDPGATGRGGMISLAQRNPGWTPGQVAQAEQGSAFPTRYDQAVPGAQTVINAFGGGAGGFIATGVTIGSSAPADYEFSRGQPGQAEDSWTCIQRLAQEVNWRAFVTGRNSVYFVTDDDLMKAPPTYHLTPHAPGMERLTFQAETGGRTVKVHRHRQPKPSEAQLTVRIDRWNAPPGAVVTLDGFGPGDGRWLTVDTQRPLFDREATVGLRSPQAPLPEPAPSASVPAAGVIIANQSQLAASGNAVDRVYAAATAIDRRNLPYVFGGGHTGSWASAASAGGLDCSSAVSLALYGGGLMPGFPGPIVSGEFASSWGQPGRGAQMTVWANAGHVFIEFYNRPAKRFDTVSGGSGGDGPHLRYTAPGSPGDTWESTGFVARHFPGF